MCGIGGKLSFGARPDEALAERMNDCMRHRGPDASGVYANGPVVLAHRRLSILDLSAAGRQPMSNRDGTVHVVFNGEIYNYRELRERVADYPFDSETDTEVLLALYEQEGVDCLRRLRGMFAFAIWDEREERLFLARDRLGQKPLYYHHDETGFTFGSTVGAVLADGRVTPDPDLPALREYLTYQYVPRPRTGFVGIEQVGPAEYLLVDDDGVRRERYWQLSFAQQSDASARMLANRLRRRLREATRLRLRSDVPVGVFLSGGLDSSVVTALVDEVSEDPVGTYSVGFEEAAYSELEYARTVADRFDTDHHEFTVTPDLVDTLPTLVGHYETPFGDPSALPTYYVSQVAADHVTVVLTGDAGDETFAGYDRYTRDRVVDAAAATPRSLRDVGRTGLGRVPESLRGRTLLRQADRALDIAEGDPVERYAELVCRTLGEDARAVWNGPEAEDELAWLRAAFGEADGPTRIDRVTHVDLRTYLPEALLVKVDRASMAHSLEARSPFLDHDVVEFAASVPAKYKWRRGEKKWLLKRAFEDVLPPDVVDRPKQGFGVPVDEWFRGELREVARERLDRLGARDPFDARGIDAEFERHVAGEANYGLRIWDLVWLEEWYAQFVD
ncbi:asparagine synthase (glutamine-hydrolyzing) [Halomarina oriensis]|uniref:Putative asparagine synthetase [glutamine-hydrolyzing] n=1 Tax=Halomarina oriensis TaxID=671145 RepID=A0A6B0GPU9_9EURY|nr:asparagine synthase (glutamine-hydrolyzing) [Halomarina oriensis]MWG34135.1 asparagine synthase (glutamine-hydrolyzing) [Halomarina oriensis]